MSGEEGWRGFLAVDGGSPGVLEDEPIGELPVEPGEIGEEKVFVVVDEGSLDGAVEAFGVGPLFGILGSAYPRAMPWSWGRWGKGGLELAPVLGEQHRGVAGSRLRAALGAASVWPFSLPGRATGLGEGRGGIDEGQDMASR